MVQVHTLWWNVYYMYMLKITYLFTSVENTALCPTNNLVSYMLPQYTTTTIYHNTMKPNIPVLDWTFSSSSWFVHLQNKQKQTFASDNYQVATTAENLVRLTYWVKIKKKNSIVHHQLVLNVYFRHMDYCIISYALISHPNLFSCSSSWHSLQTYGFTPSCRRKCVLRLPRRVNFFWQMWHVNKVPSLCDFSRCVLSFWCHVKRSEQYLHE